jgi:hypothetical protein
MATMPTSDDSGVGEWFTWHPAPAYIGLDSADATQQAHAQGVADIRLISLDEDAVALTADLRPARLNFGVRRGVVVLAGYF